MKYISFAIPCYNSEAYMEKAINSILVGGEDVEIIVVNDGSKDGTQKIAERYQEKYPTIVKAVEKENGGHGDAVNCGLAHATGKYFKVVDSDDWVDKEALKKILDAVKGFMDADSPVDMVISNYVYEKVGMKHKKVIRYDNVLPQNQVFRWDDIGRFRLDQYILMHSVIYRTEMLKLCQLELPKHTFYVDNLFVYVPMAKVKTLYYVDRVFYHYFIGREDQSVQEAVMIRRIHQQLRVNWLMLAQVDLDRVENQRLRRYLLNYLEIVTTVSCVLLFRSGTQEHLEMERAFWRDMARDYPRHYQLLSRRLFGRVLTMPGPLGRWITLGVYGLSRKIFGFN